MRTANHKPIIKDHRVARLNAWARLWLVWFVSAWAWWSRDEASTGRALDRAARLARALVVLNAGARLTLPPHRAKHRHGRLKRFNVRTIAGARLRRALRSGEGAARLFAILGVIRDMERHVRAILRRLPRGLTRLRVILPLPNRAPLDESRAPLARPAIADTS